MMWEGQDREDRGSKVLPNVGIIHGVTNQKTWTSIFNAEKASNFAYFLVV
jgi:hypothetical protein